MRLTAYHADGKHGPILPKEWDGIVDRLKGLAASLEVENSNREITRPQWLKKSIQILPAGVFVWKDELEKSFSRFSAETGTLEGDRPNDGKLNFSPLIPGRMREKVIKGFRKDAAPKQAGDAAIERARVPAVSKQAPTTDTPPRVTDEAQVQTGTAHSGATEKSVPEEIVRKRDALIAELSGMWPTIEGDLRDGSRSGLSAVANAKHGYWRVGPALNWAAERGKIQREKAEAFVRAEGESEMSVLLRAMLNRR